MTSRAASVELRQLELGPMANFVYVIADPVTRACAVVDPAWDVPGILRAIEEGGYKLERILVTHNHPDHVNGIAELLESADVPVHVHRDDAYALKPFQSNLRESSGGDKIKLGNVEIALLHTPGHTEGSQCFLFDDRLVTGDTLFIGSCGRVDLPTSDPEKMYRSLKKLSALPDRTLVFPGHNYAEDVSASLKSEKQRNPYLRSSAASPLDDFLRLVGA